MSVREIPNYDLHLSPTTVVLQYRSNTVQLVVDVYIAVYPHYKLCTGHEGMCY